MLTTLLTLLAIGSGLQSHVALPGWFVPFVDIHITDFLRAEPIVCGAFSETETNLPVEMHRALACAETLQKLKQAFRVVQYGAVQNGATPSPSRWACSETAKGTPSGLVPAPA